MDFLKFITNNYVMFYELFGLLIMLFISAHIPLRMKRLTRVALLLLLCSAITHELELWTQTFETITGWRIFLTTLKYTFYPLILFCLIELVSKEKADISVKWKTILTLPILIAIPLYATSQLTGLVFKFTEENHYTSGPLAKLPYIIFAFYMVLFVFRNVIYLKNYSNRNRIIALYICIGAIVGVVLCMIFTEDSNHNPMFISSIVLYYLFIYIHLASIDSLTGLLNRQNYYNDMVIYSKKYRL